MSFTLDVPETMTGGGEYIDQPGAYHFIVTEIREGKNSKDEIFAGFSIELQVRAGKDDSQVGKKINLNLINGNLEHKDGGEMCRRKQAAFLIAANVIGPTDLGKKGISIDLEKARGAQLCAELVRGDVQPNGKQYLDVNFANFWHVDDPRAKDVPKAADELTVIPQQYRHPAEYFAPLQVVGKKQSAPAASRVQEDDFAGL